MFRGKRDSVESRLRDERPTPPDDLVRQLESRVGERSVQRPSGLRTGVAIGFAAVFAAVVAIVGGFSLLPGSTTSTAPRLSVIVPKAAVPAIRELQARGVRLATPVATAGTTTKFQAIKINTKSAIKLDADVAIKVNDKVSVSKPIRLAPVVTSTAALVRFPSANVYPPGSFTLMCVAVPSDPDIIWYTTWVPSGDVSWVLANYPGSYYGFCKP